MFQKIENYLILKNSENFEEHIAKIIELEKESRKIKLQLIDENKNIYYKRNKELEVLIPHDKELFLFKSSVIYYDILDKIVTIEYPNEIDKILRRQHTRYDINVALDKSYRLEDLINELFEVARYNSEKIILEKEDLDIRLMFEQIIDDFYPVLVVQEKNIHLNQDEDITLYGDADKLSRVFSNVIKNAISYSKDHTDINIDSKHFWIRTIHLKAFSMASLC